MTPVSVQIISIVVMALVGLCGSYVALIVFRRNDERRRDKEDREHAVQLARLEEKVDSIPERMNGKILKALSRHRNLCPGGTSGTNPRMQAWENEGT